MPDLERIALPPTPIVADYVRGHARVNMSSRRLLDVGCGMGRNTIAMAQLGYQEVVGIDIDHEALAVAERRAGHHGLTACKFVQMDAFEARDLGEFDMVLGNEIFHKFDFD